MKIGIATDFYFPWVGGPSTVIRTIGHGLAARGHSVSLLAPSGEGASTIEREGPLTVYRAATVPVPFGFKLRTAIVPRGSIARWLEAERPDVVHIHHPFPLSATAAAMARARGIPVAATNHTIPDCSLWGLRGRPKAHEIASRAFAGWIRHLLSECRAVATPTETAAEALRTLGFAGPITVISNGVDTARFKPRPADGALRRRFRLDDRPVVLYTGRLDAEKEMDVWLRAAAALRRTRDAQFLVGGEGAERKHLEALARTLGLEQHVHFIGYLTDEEFPAVYSLASLYCITSRVELQSISTLEAIASGLPVVAVAAGALPELVRHGENGLLTPPGQPDAIAAACAYLLSGEQERRAMGMHSRTIALGHTLESTVVAYEEFLGALPRHSRA